MPGGRARRRSSSRSRSRWRRHRSSRSLLLARRLCRASVQIAEDRDVVGSGRSNLNTVADAESLEPVLEAGTSACRPTGGSRRVSCLRISSRLTADAASYPMSARSAAHGFRRDDRSHARRRRAIASACSRSANARRRRDATRRNRSPLLTAAQLSDDQAVARRARLARRARFAAALGGAVHPGVPRGVGRLARHEAARRSAAARWPRTCSRRSDSRR